MDQTTEKPQEPGVSKIRTKSSARAVPRRKMQRTRSFTDALKEKYCSQDDSQCDFIIVFRGKPRNNGPTTAELAHLRNVVLSNRQVSTGGLPENGLFSLCPNVTDLDLSCNLLESWAELLPLLSQLPHLKFLNLSRNHITRHKEELWRWSTPLPKVENVVLNYTGIPLREVLALARLMPALRELHICCNYYRDLGSVELAINDGALSKLECLRLNENIITSWSEVWKLRSLPCLTQLILSENPLCDVFYTTDCEAHDASMFEMDSPDITCHSDGEDSSFGSPRFRYPTAKTRKTMDPSPSPRVRRRLAFTNTDTHDSPQLSQSAPSKLQHQSHLVDDLLDDIISNVCHKMSIQETGEDSNQNSSKGANCGDCRLQDVDSFEGESSRPEFYLGERESDVKKDQSGEGCGAEREVGGTDKVVESAGTGNEGVPSGQQQASSGQEEAAAAEESDTSDYVPFTKLHTLCLSRTSICDQEHLQALTEFPALHSLRIMDITLFSHLHQEDRRKLFVASLSKVKILNGSEVTSTERDKAERHYLRHFLEQEDKSPRYMELERKHGPVQPLFDIDLGARFQTHAALTFVLCGKEQFKETISLLQPVGKLRSYIAERMAIPRRSFRMFHNACGPYQDPADHSFDELFLDSLPLSRFDFLDGDELHVDFMTGEPTRPIIRDINTVSIR